MGRRLGELLVADGRISEAVLRRALELQETQARGLRLGAILLRWGLIPERTLLDTLAKVHRCPSVDWATLSMATQEVVNLISGAQSKRLGAVPYAADKKTVQVAFANPSDLAALDEVASITRRRVIPAVTTEVRLLQAQQKYYQRPLARDIWAILQRIERPAQARPAPELAVKARPKPFVLPPESTSAPILEDELILAPPPELIPPTIWVEATEESKRSVEACPYPASEAASEEAIDEVGIEDLLQPANASPAESVPVNVEPVGEQSVPVLRRESIGRAASRQSLPDEWLADETTLADFVEQALAYYEAQPAFLSALDALESGEIEDLNAQVVGADPADTPETSPVGPRVDSTKRSQRRDQRPDAEPEVAV